MLYVLHFNIRTTLLDLNMGAIVVARVWAKLLQILGGIADTVAQTLTTIRQKSLRQSGGVQKDDFVSIEIHELDRKNPLSPMELIPPSRNLPPPFDFERLTRFMAYGFIMSPLQYHWFAFLSKSFPITKTAGFSAVSKRVACDQLMFSPVGMQKIPLLYSKEIRSNLDTEQVLHAFLPS